MLRHTLPLRVVGGGGLVARVIVVGFADGQLRHPRRALCTTPMGRSGAVGHGAVRPNPAAASPRHLEADGPGGAAGVEAASRPRENWEFVPTPEHKSLVLLLYRNILKGLINYKSIRRRSMIAYARFCFRRRGTATEKLLIDECIEEARRAIYVLEKHHTFTRTGTYEFDIMGLPKDTGQDVKTYMEEHYDPEYSRQQFQHFQDVQPGREQLHNQKGLGPTSGSHHWKDQTSAAGFKVDIRDEDKAMRPPPPPDGE